MSKSITQVSTIAFVWENFGPMHVDRCEAVALRLKGQNEVIGIEICGASSTYDWVPERGANFRKITIFPNTKIEDISVATRAWRVIRACLDSRAHHILFCHYEHPSTFISAAVLRMLGRRVFVMNDSKFDDYQRHLLREVGKSLFYSPYAGGLASGARSRDYLRFMGLPQDRVLGVYNSLSIDRIRKLAGVERAPGGTPFSERYIAVVARLVPKKNLKTAIAAYGLYRKSASQPRPLHFYGSGKLEGELRAQVEREGLKDHVHFHGFLQTADICKALGSALLLLLPSIEEQFGNVVIEAQAMGVPVVLSANCGAIDTLVHGSVNGFIVESMNVEGYAFFMKLLSDDEELWRRMSAAADRTVANGDAELFAQAVETLVSLVP